MADADIIVITPAGEEKTDRKPKVIKPFVIPQWFQSKCLKSPDELAGITSGIVIKRNAQEPAITESVISKRTSALFDDAVKISGSKVESVASDASADEGQSTPATTTSSSISNVDESGTQQQVVSPIYQLEEEVYVSLKHTIVPTVTFSDESNAFEQPTGIVIKVESVEALRHADAAVLQIAKDLKTRLIVLDPEDLEDLAADFHVESTAAEKVETEERRVKRAAKKAKEEKKAAKDKAKRRKEAAEEKTRKKEEAAKEAAEKKEGADKTNPKQDEQVTVKPTDESSIPSVQSDSVTQIPKTDAASITAPHTPAESMDKITSKSAEVDQDSRSSNVSQSPVIIDQQSETSKLTTQSTVVSTGVANETVTSDSKRANDDKSSNTTSSKQEVPKATTEDSSSSEEESETEDEPPVDDTVVDPDTETFYPYHYDIKTTSFPLTVRYFDPVCEQLTYKQAKKRGAVSMRYLITGQEAAPEDDTVKSDSLAEQTPVIVQLRYINRLLNDDAANRIFHGLRSSFRSYRSVGQRVVLLMTAVSNEEPFTITNTDDDGSSSPWEPSGGGLSTFMNDMDIDDSAFFELKIVDKIEDLKSGPADTPTGYKAQRIKRRLRHGFTLASLPWLDPSADWSKLDTGILTAMKKEAWTDDRLRQAARQILGCALAKSALEFSDVLSSVERIDKGKEAKQQTEEEKKFDEKLEKVRRTCNDYESRLLSCVVKPSTLGSTYDDVIMDTETKDTVKQLISLFKLKTTSKSQKLLKLLNINGAMFYGAPGTGKTHLCRAMATDQSACMLAVDPSSIADMWVGETEKLIKAAFTLATKLSPCLLFIDEADALFRKRSACDKSWERSSLTMFLTMMDGISTDKKRPFVVVATNRPADLDDAFLRRLPHKVLFRLPGEQHRAEILRLFVKDEDVAPDVKFTTLARLTVGFSGSDLKSLCGQAVLAWAMENAITQGEGEVDLQLNTAHFTKALQRTRPTVSAQSLREIEDWAKQFNHGR